MRCGIRSNSRCSPRSRGLNWDKLSVEQRLELLRVYELTLYRLGAPDEATRNALIARFDGWYPSR